MIEHVRDLYAWTDGANRALVDAAGELTEAELRRELGGSFPSLLATLAHMALSEWIWLQRWTGTSPAGPPPGWDGEALDAVAARWAEVANERGRFLAALTEKGLDRPLSYADTRGTPHEGPLVELLLHASHHASYHRGQAVNFLRMLGRTPPHTDLILFYRGRRAQEVPR